MAHMPWKRIANTGIKMDRNDILVLLLIVITTTTEIFANDPRESDLYSVTYDQNSSGEVKTPADEKKYKAGAWFTIKGCPERDTRQFFLGWNTSPDGKGTHYRPNSRSRMGNSDLKLYAQWVSHGITKHATFRIWNNPFKDLRDCIIQGNHLFYLSRASEGLDIADISQNTPKLVGGFRGNGIGMVKDFIIEKDRAYLASQIGGL